MNFRDWFSIGYMGFVLIWFVVWGFIIALYGVSVGEALGIGTASGIFLKGFGDITQFYFRKRPADERGVKD